MGKTEKKESESLGELKERLWCKIQILDSKLESLDEKSDDFRKALDAYHKIVKAYVDIVKVQHYAPGNLVDQTTEDDIVKLMNKVHVLELRAKENKVALQEFKDFLQYSKKGSLSARKIRR